MGRQWQDPVMLVLGVWLLFSPFVLDYGPALGAARNAHLVGAAVAMLALVGLVRAPLWSAWGQLALGLWLMASAFALAGASPAAHWHLLAVGVLVVILGLAAVFLRAGHSGRAASSR